MTPAEVRTMSDSAIVEMLVSVKPGDEAVAWLASVIVSPAMVEGIKELSRRYAAHADGTLVIPRARHASSLTIDGAKFKRIMWLNRIPLNQVGPMIGKCDAWASVIAHKGRMSYWCADAIANELGMHVDSFIEAIASPEELQRLMA